MSTDLRLRFTDASHRRCNSVPVLAGPRRRSSVYLYNNPHHYELRTLAEQMVKAIPHPSFPGVFANPERDRQQSWHAAMQAAKQGLALIVDHDLDVYRSGPRCFTAARSCVRCRQTIDRCRDPAGLDLAHGARA